MKCPVTISSFIFLFLSVKIRSLSIESPQKPQRPSASPSAFSALKNMIPMQINSIGLA